MHRPQLTLYTRAGCHLCEAMKAVVEEVAREWPLDLQEIDIDADGELRERYGTEIPVLLIDGRKAFKYRVDAASLRRALARRQRQRN